MKTCAACKETKPREQFAKRSAAKDGKQAYCRDCGKAKLKSRYEAKREESLEWQKDYYRKNADDRRQYGRRYMLENQHRGWKAFYIARCKKYGVTPVVEDFTEAEMIAEYGDACFWCGGPWTDLDHVATVRDGGPHTLANCRPSCSPCNRARGIESDRKRRERIQPI